MSEDASRGKSERGKTATVPLKRARGQNNTSFSGNRRYGRWITFIRPSGVGVHVHVKLKVQQIQEKNDESIEKFN